jgi:hypothetical protein
MAPLLTGFSFWCDSVSMETTVAYTSGMSYACVVAAYRLAHGDSRN